MNTPDLDVDKPSLIPELIAEGITTDPATVSRLCARARRHWKTNAGFRNSFKRKDERDVLAMWFEHWIAGEAARENKKPLPPVL